MKLFKIRKLNIYLNISLSIFGSMNAGAHSLFQSSDHAACRVIERGSFQQGLGLFSLADTSAINRFVRLSERKIAEFRACDIDLYEKDFRYREALSRSITKGHYSVPGIDRIIMINLDRRPEKLKASVAELSPYGIRPDRLSAVDGKLLSPTIVSGMGVPFHPDMLCFMSTRYLGLDSGREAGRSLHEVIHPANETWLVHHASRMQIGCYLSHISALWEVYKSGASTAWILEDDIHVVRDPNLIQAELIALENIVGQDGWDMLFTDLDHKNQKGETVTCCGYAMRPDLLVENDVFNRTEISSDFIRYGSRYGTHSYIVNRSGMRKLLAFFHIFGMYAPIDLDMCVIPGIRIFGMKNSMIETNSMVHD